MNEEWKEIKQIKGISEVLQISMCNNMPLSVNEKRKIFDFIIDLQQKVEQLEKENKILKENAEHNDKVVDKVNWENMLLKRKNKEIERLNNIINELEKYCEENSKLDYGSYDRYGDVLDKLKELKDSD